MSAEIITAQQIIIQLKKFNQQVLKQQQMASVRQQAYSNTRSTSSRATDLELQDILGKPNSERLDIDASPMGKISCLIIKHIMSVAAYRSGLLHHYIHGSFFLQVLPSEWHW